MDRNNILALDIATAVMVVVEAETPSEYIPFKGDFPLLKQWQQDKYYDGIIHTEYYDDLDEWIKSIIVKGKRIYDINNGFIEYLKEDGLENLYFKLSSSDKATELMKFFNKNKITIESLKIK